MSPYSILVRIANKRSEKEKMSQLLLCMKEFCQYYHSKYGNSFSAVSDFRILGAGMWMYLNDIEEYFWASSEAKRILDDMTKNEAAGSYKEMRINWYKARIEIDELEACIIIQDYSKFQNILESLMKNPQVNENYHVVILALNSIRLIIKKDFYEAKKVLKNLLVRYEQLPEFVSSYIWDGLHAWIDKDESHEMKAVNNQIKNLMDALDGKKTPEKSAKLHSILEWLNKQVN